MARPGSPNPKRKKLPSSQEILRDQTDWEPPRGKLRRLPLVKRVKRKDGTSKLQCEKISPVQDYPTSVRTERIVDFLETCALVGGDASAGKAVLDWRRWRAEMKQGRPGSRKTDDQAGQAIQLIDDLGTADTSSNPPDAPQDVVDESTPVQASPKKD
jgi:hypothetical protein